MKLLRNICRILVGIVFIYSGFVSRIRFDPADCRKCQSIINTTI